MRHVMRVETYEFDWDPAESPKYAYCTSDREEAGPEEGYLLTAEELDTIQRGSGQPEPPEVPEPIPLLTEDQAAQLLALQPCTLKKWRVEDRGPTYVRMGSAVRYRYGDLREFVMRARIPSPKRRSKIVQVLVVDGSADLIALDDLGRIWRAGSWGDAVRPGWQMIGLPPGCESDDSTFDG